MDQLELATVLATMANNDNPATRKIPLGSLLADDWFVLELRNILKNEWNQGVVSWLPEGKIWRVHDLAAFQATILSRFPVMKDSVNSLDLFLAYAKVKGFHEISRGLNSIAFYHPDFIRGAPLDEIVLPARLPATKTTATVPVVHAEELSKKKTRLPGMPLPPPPFTLANKRNMRPALVVDTNTPCGKINSTYMVDSSLGNMNCVTLLLKREDKTAKKVSTTCAIDLPKVSPGASPRCSPKPSRKRKEPIMADTSKPKKPRKKWLPSLGPPEAESLRILARTASQSTWYCDNAELFSTLSSLSRQ